jgi:hypothetical protein
MNLFVAYAQIPYGKNKNYFYFLLSLVKIDFSQYRYFIIFRFSK